MFTKIPSTADIDDYEKIDLKIIMAKLSTFIS